MEWACERVQSPEVGRGDPFGIRRGSVEGPQERDPYGILIGSVLDPYRGGINGSIYYGAKLGVKGCKGKTWFIILNWHAVYIQSTDDHKYSVSNAYKIYLLVYKYQYLQWDIYLIEVEIWDTQVIFIMTTKDEQIYIIWFSMVRYQILVIFMCYSSIYQKNQVLSHNSCTMFISQDP